MYDEADVVEVELAEWTREHEEAEELERLRHEQSARLMMIGV